jgi:hypothetical protein
MAQPQAISRRPTLQMMLPERERPVFAQNDLAQYLLDVLGAANNKKCKTNGRSTLLFNVIEQAILCSAPSQLQNNVTPPGNGTKRRRSSMRSRSMATRRRKSVVYNLRWNGSQGPP